MAQTKVVSGNVTTYTITDTEGNSVAIAKTQSFGGSYTLLFTSSGGLHVDGQAQVANLMQLLSTGLTP